MLAKTSRKRPSEILNVFDQWAAYCVDEVVITFGIHIENLLNKTDKKGKPLHKLQDLLNPPVSQKEAVKRLMSMMGVQVIDKRKKQVKQENGT